MLPPGSCFLGPCPNSASEHLYIIISPAINDKVVLVNLTTDKFGKDRTCILKKGEHPFVVRDSVINYGDAVDADVSKIEEALAAKIFKPRDSVSSEILKRIQEGARTSPAFKPSLLKYIPN